MHSLHQWRTPACGGSLRTRRLEDGARVALAVRAALQQRVQQLACVRASRLRLPLASRLSSTLCAHRHAAGSSRYTPCRRLQSSVENRAREAPAGALAKHAGALRARAAAAPTKYSRSRSSVGLRRQRRRSGACVCKNARRPKNADAAPPPPADERRRRTRRCTHWSIAFSTCSSFSTSSSRVCRSAPSSTDGSDDSLRAGATLACGRHGAAGLRHPWDPAQLLLSDSRQRRSDATARGACTHLALRCRLGARSWNPHDFHRRLRLGRLVHRVDHHGVAAAACGGARARARASEAGAARRVVLADASHPASCPARTHPARRPWQPRRGRSGACVLEPTRSGALCTRHPRRRGRPRRRRAAA